jgi:hypothetical protein
MSSGIPFAVGLLVDGVVVRGAIAPPERLAAALDDGIEALTSEIWRDSPDQLEPLREVLAGVFATVVRVQREKLAEARTALEPYDPHGSIDDFKPEDVDAFLRSERPALAVDLADAVVMVGGIAVNVGVLRIEASHIAAWWPLQQEPDVYLNIVRPG